MVAGVVIDAPANVAAPEVGAEMPVISKERWEELRRMRAEGHSVSQMACACGLDRKTIRSCLRKAQWSAYRRSPLAKTLLSRHRAWRLEPAPEVNYSAQILCQELRGTRDYRGGYDTVRNAVRPSRKGAAAAALTQCRFETEQGQVGITGHVRRQCSQPAYLRGVAAVRLTHRATPD